MTTPEEIISDDAVTRVHGYANFGSMTPREVLADGVLKYAMGYSGGHTQLCILMEHKLIKKPKPGKCYTTLTKLGQKYLRAAHPIATLRAAPDATAALDRAVKAARDDERERCGLAVANVEIGFYDGISGDWHPLPGPSIISAACDAIRALAHEGGE